MPRSQSFSVVAAFEIGSTGSRLAYSYKSDTNKLYINENWSNDGTSHTLCLPKCPTSVLVDDKEQFHSFGFKAESHFASLTVNRKQTGWRLFRQFPIQLYNNKNLSEQTQILDHEGNEYSAIDVFSMAIKYLRSIFEGNILSETQEFKETDAQYVIPIPAMWGDAGKQFIKSSAIKAGFVADRLQIPFEDQLAAIWCTFGTGQANDLKSVGSKFMVINLGDASANFTVHQRISDSSNKDLHRTSCTAWGGINIDQKFIQHLENLFGKEAIDEFRKKDIGGFLEMLRNFEIKKRSYAIHSKYGLKLDLPCIFLEIIIKRNMNTNLSFGKKLRIDSSEGNLWFEQITKPLVDQMNALLGQDNIQDVHTIILVGELAESRFVQERLIAELRTRILVVPDDAALTILKGALLFGHNPDRFDETCLMVAAFDIGTTFSGYCYSHINAPTKVLTNRNWCSGGLSPTLVTTKTPSSLLIDDKEQFHSFGFEAEDHFAALREVDKRRGWRLFRHYTIHLNAKKHLSKCSTIEDVDGKSYPAITILAMTIRYLHRHLLKDLKLRSPIIHEHNIRYIIAVPTVWDVEGQQAMRDVANEAGIDDNRLTMTFEDQAAAKWCTREGGPAPGLKTTGSKYMVIDLGGATTDITVHQRYFDAKIKVANKVRVGAWGGVSVDQKFLQHMESILGKETLESIYINNIGDYLEMIRSFESQKRSLGAHSKNVINIVLPKYLPLTVKNLPMSSYPGTTCIELTEVNSWFEQIAKPLIEHIKGGHESYRDVSTILLVGGIAESFYVQQRLREELSGISIVVPDDAGLVVMKGAVLLGHDPDRSYMTSLVVAAFDFGTTYSGYAYAYKHDPTKVHANQNWYSGGASSKLVTLKTPTSVLLDDKGSFHSFGFEAEDQFVALAEQGKHKGWRLFRRFKMRLHNTKNLSRRSTVEDIEGKSYPAMDIIAMAIQYLHKHLLEALNLASPSLLEADIQYIITVPAIWDVAAKQFMREAAIKAGIESERLELALESEVAAIWCAGSNTGAPRIERISPGSKYIVIDLGGGTADITVFQSLPDGKVRIVHKATGGAWGGTCVDQLYLEYLDKLLGGGVLDKLHREHMDDYFELIRDFETKKRSKRIHSDDDCIVRLPCALLDSVRKGNGPASKLTDKLRIDRLKVDSWFHKPLSNLIEHVNALRTQPKIKDAQTILLVGGFAESVYVQATLRKELSGITLIVPEEAGLTILKGAVLYGHNPGVVTSRVMDYTYGIAVYNDFNEAVHPQENKVFVSGKWRINNCFHVFVRVNEEIAVDQEVSHLTYPTNSRASSYSVHRTLVENPTYTTDPGCGLLGTLRMKNIENVPLGDQGTLVTFMFGHSELLVKLKHTLTGEVETLTLDCLQ